MVSVRKYLAEQCSRGSIAVLVVALVLRAVVIAGVLVGMPLRAFFTKGLEMGWLAQSILDGKGLASPFGVPTGPTAFIAPGYPLLVAAVFRLCGSYSQLAACVLMTVNLLANLITLLLLMRIARRLFGQEASLAAGLVWACSPVLWWMPTIFWETSLSACFLTGLLCFALEDIELQDCGWLVLGAVCAFAAMVNPALLPIILAVLSWKIAAASASWRSRTRHFALSATALIVVFSPWPLRNARVFHAFIPLRTTIGFELWMGNRPGADGYLDESLFPAYNRGQLADYRRMGEVAYTAHKEAEGLACIRQAPVAFAKLTATRTVRFWSGTGNRNGSILFLLHATFTTLLGLLGMWLLRRRYPGRVLLLLALPLVLFPIPYCITHAEFRYRLVVDPLLTALAGGALAAAASRLKERTLRPVETAM